MRPIAKGLIFGPTAGAPETGFPGLDLDGERTLLGDVGIWHDVGAVVPRPEGSAFQDHGYGRLLARQEGSGRPRGRLRRWRYAMCLPKG